MNKNVSGEMEMGMAVAVAVSLFSLDYWGQAFLCGVFVLPFAFVFWYASQRERRAGGVYRLLAYYRGIDWRSLFASQLLLN